jgi:hypothetical protein
MAPRSTRDAPVTDPAIAIALHLTTGEFPDDEEMRATCANIALIVTSLKTYGRVYDLSILDPRSAKSYGLRVHTAWTVAASSFLEGHLLECSAAYDTLMKADHEDMRVLTVTIPAFKPLLFTLQAPEPEGPGTPGSVGEAATPTAAKAAKATAPTAAKAAKAAAPTAASKPPKPPTPAMTAAAAARSDAPDTAAATTAVIRFRCLTCTALYKSPVNAARCAATHPPAGSRLTRRTYDAAAVAGFWDALPYGARLDMLEPILPLVGTTVVRAPGAELLEIMDAQACENLALCMVHSTPHVIREDHMDESDFIAATCYRVMDVIIKAMEAEAAAKERALLEELEAEARLEADRKSRRDAKQKTKREAREAMRREKTLARLANDDAFFRSFIPGCTHWYLDE